MARLDTWYTYVQAASITPGWQAPSEGLGPLKWVKTGRDQPHVCPHLIRTDFLTHGIFPCQRNIPQPLKRSGALTKPLMRSDQYGRR
jgi:hypothetical protein